MGVRDMSPGEAFARAEELLAKWLREEGGSRLDIEIIGLGLAQSVDVWIVVGGEVRRDLSESSETGFAVDRLREKQVVLEWGAWTWSRLWMVAGEWVLHQECDWMREPVFDPPGGGRPVPATCALELERYPRAPENVPEWLAAKAAVYEEDGWWDGS